ncbi:MAG: AraC family transcriptional regulator [Chitinophagaceae bacterium]
MKVVQFTIPVAKEHSVIVQEDMLPHFYHHLHRHNETQITWILKGKGTLIAGNYMQPFKPGDIYLLGANQPHIFKSDPPYFDKRRKMGIHALTFFFNPDGFLKPLLELPELKTVKKFVQRSSYGLQLPGQEQKKVVEEMLLVKKAKQGMRLAAFIRMLQIMADIKEWKTLATVSAENSFSDTEGLRMNDVYQFTMDNFQDNIRLKQVAGVACMTPQAFCRYFKKHTRKTYINFLNEIRISEACKKILSGDAGSMSSVAYGAGFSSAVSFNRVFKKITGHAPLQYLKAFKQQAD